MKPGHQRFARLAELAAAAGARALPVGDGCIEVLHLGQRIPLRSLAEFAKWLKSVDPEHVAEIGRAAKRTARRKRQRCAVAKKGARNHA